MGWLMAQSSLVKKIAHDAEREDGGGKGVACCL